MGIKRGNWWWLAVGVVALAACGRDAAVYGTTPTSARNAVAVKVASTTTTTSVVLDATSTSTTPPLTAAPATLPDGSPAPAPTAPAAPIVTPAPIEPTEPVPPPTAAPPATGIAVSTADCHAVDALTVEWTAIVSVNGVTQPVTRAQARGTVSEQAMTVNGVDIYLWSEVDGATGTCLIEVE